MLTAAQLDTFKAKLQTKMLEVAIKQAEAELEDDYDCANKHKCLYRFLTLYRTVFFSNIDNYTPSEIDDIVGYVTYIGELSEVVPVTFTNYTIINAGQDHVHTISQIIGLQDYLDNLSGSHNDLSDVSILLPNTIVPNDGKAWHLGYQVAQQLLTNFYPALAPSATISVIPNGLLNYKSVNIAFTISGTAIVNNINANLKNVTVQVSRSNPSLDSSWTTVSSISSGFTTVDTHIFNATNTNTISYVGNGSSTINNSPFYFRLKVTDTADTVSYSVVQTVSFLGYQVPVTTVTTIEDSIQEYGKFNYKVDASVVRQSSNVNLTGAKLQYFTDDVDGGVWTDVAGGVLTGTGASYSISSFDFVLPSIEQQCNYIKLRVAYRDTDYPVVWQSGNIYTITFKHKFKAFWSSKNGIGIPLNSTDIMTTTPKVDIFADSYLNISFISPTLPSGELYFFIAFPSATIPSKVEDTTESPTVSYNDYIDCGNISGLNANSFSTTWRVLRHSVSTSAFRNRTLETK